MLSLDLFDSKYERRLHEGAVDDAEYARLKKLGEKIDYLKQAKAKTKDSEMRRAIDQRIQQYDDERREILSVRGMGEAEQPQQPAKGQDLVTPQQRVAGATPPPTSMLGKAKQTLGSFANWLAGKDDVGPTYESELNETDENSLINKAKYVWEQIRRAHDGNVDIATIRWLDNSEPVTMSRNQLYHAVQKIKAMSRQNRNAFATQTLADRNNFYLWLGSQKKITPRPALKQPSDPFQPELPLGKPKVGPVQERTQKKKSDDIQAGDVKVARELQKLRAQYPAARSDVEAVARAEIDSSERSNQQIASIRGANEKQDALLRQLVALDREQGREIDSLDSENNNLEKQLARVQATNDRLQKALGQMTGTKKASRTSTTKPVATPVAPTEVDPATVKKVQDLESQIQALQSRSSTPDIEKKISDLQSRINALPAQAAQALNIGKDKPSTAQVSRPQAPAGDLDVKPTKAKTAKPKAKTAKPKAKTVEPAPTSADDDLNILDLEEPDLFAVKEHGGGIGPRQHWQDLMKEEELVEGIKDATAATAVIACLLTGGSLTGCATAPQKTTAQQVLKTGQDVGRTVQTAQRITRAGVEAEVNQEIRNLLRGIGGRPEELNHSNILRIWRKIKGAPPVEPEPQAPEYGPADPVKRTPQYEGKEINTREDFVKERDRLLRMITQETNPANKQILRTAIKQLEGRAENEGWISLQQRMIREDTAALAAEDAILKRIFVRHKDLMMEYGTEKITQAAESVAYNVGDIAHITDEQINEWVGQVEYILGAKP